MTHDPLCSWYGSTEFETVIGCDDCDLIAKVRVEESNRVMTMRYTQVKGWQEMKEAIAYQQGMEDMLAKCIAAVLGVSVYRWPYSEPHDEYTECITVDGAVAALRALQEKP